MRRPESGISPRPDPAAELSWLLPCCPLARAAQPQNDALTFFFLSCAQDIMFSYHEVQAERSRFMLFRWDTGPAFAQAPSQSGQVTLFGCRQIDFGRNTSMMWRLDDGGSDHRDSFVGPEWHMAVRGGGLWPPRRRRRRPGMPPRSADPITIPRRVLWNRSAPALLPQEVHPDRFLKLVGGVEPVPPRRAFAPEPAAGTLPQNATAGSEGVSDA